MKRWLSHLIICVYLGALSIGIVSHTLQFGTAVHPGMYFLVWDMFCGWSAFSQRIHIVGEGEDGHYYQLTPGPWGEFRPFGRLGRQHYDVLFNTSARLALNTLRHTRHVPMTRFFVVEECWPKKFNVPERIWQWRYDEPKDVQKYYHVKSVFSPDGTPLADYPTWISQQYALSVSNNPRLRADARRGREFYAVNPRNRNRGQFGQTGIAGAPPSLAGGSPFRRSAH